MYIKITDHLPTIGKCQCILLFLNSSTAKMHAENTFKIVLYLHMHEVQQVYQRDLEYQYNNSLEHGHNFQRSTQWHT